MQKIEVNAIGRKTLKKTSQKLPKFHEKGGYL